MFASTFAVFKSLSFLFSFIDKIPFQIFLNITIPFVKYCIHVKISNVHVTFPCLLPYKQTSFPHFIVFFSKSRPKQIQITEKEWINTTPLFLLYKTLYEIVFVAFIAFFTSVIIQGIKQLTPWDHTKEFSIKIHPQNFLLTRYHCISLPSDRLILILYRDSLHLFWLILAFLLLFFPNDH